MNEKLSEMCLLFDFYGSLLSERQRDVLDLYYNDDLSLSEIAENLSITRQAVRDAVLHGEDYLRLLEEKLGMAERFKEVRAIAARIISLSADENIKKEAEKLLN